MINKILKKIKLLFRCYSKCTMNKNDNYDDYEDRDKENYITDRIKIITNV